MAAPSEKDLFQHALGLHQKGMLPLAEALYHDLLERNPKHFEALHLLGLIRYKQGKLEEAEKLIKQALTIDPKFANAHYNLALCLDELRKFEEAIKHYERAGDLGFDKSQIENAIGGMLVVLGRPAEALPRLNNALRLNPNFADALANRALALRGQGNMMEALAAADKALAVNPNAKNVRLVLGYLLTDLRENEEGLKHLERAKELGADSVEFHEARATALRELNRFDEALAEYDEIKKLRPENDNHIFDVFGIKTKICQWDDYAADVAIARKLKADWIASVKPFILTQMVDEPVECLAAAKEAADLIARNPALQAKVQAPAVAKSSGKIKIGYFSGDFCSHPVGQLIGGVIAAHDKSQFEIHAFSQGKVTGDEYQNRIIEGADRYYHTQKFSPEMALAQAREKGLDIAVDLAGFTAFGRPYLFAGRVAPIQVNYLGYPGTMGSSTTDYIVADQSVIPESAQAYYTEKVAYLPDCFLPHDPSREIGANQMTRAQVGLPEGKFVFCSFNNYAKLTPDTFSRWMRVLSRVPDSVLWLPKATTWLRENLKREAEARGISAGRLYFAPFASRSEYFDRFALADLFLDSFPYNAHTTAGDALWGGVPVLTLAGKGFASRVAASAVKAAGLPELATHSVEDFEELAVKLASDPARIAAYKQHLAEERASLALFDVPRYTRHLEQAFLLMLQRQKLGLSPDHIYVKRQA